MLQALVPPSAGTGWRRTRSRLAVLLATVCALGALAGQRAAAATIKVGQVLPLSGPAAPIGLALAQGAEVYFAQAHAAGALNGHRVQLLRRDDQFLPERTLQQARELIDGAQVVALLNVVGAPNNIELHARGLLPGAAVSVVGPVTGSTRARALDSAYLHFVRAGVADEARTVARRLKTLGVQRVALLRAADSHGLDAAQQLRLRLADHGLALAAESAYAPSGVDVIDAVDRLRALDLQAVLHFGTSSAAAEVVRRYRQAGGGALVVLGSASNPEGLLQALGPELARGIGLVQVVPPPSRTRIPVVKEYVDALARHGPPGARPTSTGLEGFIAAKLLAQAIRRCGAEPTAAAISSALRVLGPADLGGFTVNLSSAARLPGRYTEIAIIGADGPLRN